MEDRIPKPTRRSERCSSALQLSLPESPRGPMEFLSRSWSVSALEVSKAVATQTTTQSNNNNVNVAAIITSGSGGGVSISTTSSSSCTTASIPEDVAAETEDLITDHNRIIGAGEKLNQFSFASNATSQLVLERIMSQSEVSPLTSGRLSHSSGPLVNDSPPVSPTDDFDDVVKYFRTHNSIQPLFNGSRASAGNGIATPVGGSKTVGRWLKDRKEKKKEETRAHNAQVHAAVSVAAVAAAVAAITAATAASSSSPGEGKKEQSSKTDMAMASAATLVAAQCVEAAESMGAERDNLASVVSSAVNVHSHDDIATLTAAAATALRGAATLKARALKEVWNIAAVLPAERGPVTGACGKGNYRNLSNGYSGELVPGEDFMGICNLELLAKGSELLKRTRNGDLHWKIVSVYINKLNQVTLKMKSKHVARTITKKKKKVVIEVCKDLPAWPGRHLFDSGEQRRHFGLKTEKRMIEFECRNGRDYVMWTEGVTRLLAIVAARKNSCLT